MSYIDKLKKKAGKLIQRTIDRAMGNGLMQESVEGDGEKYLTEGIDKLIRRAGADSCVLLKNDGNVLPLKEGEEIAVFGRCQLDWFYVGYGSGGDVNAPYKVNLIEGLKNNGISFNREVFSVYEAWTSLEDNKADDGWWGHWPMSYPEMPLDRELVELAAKEANKAVVVIGRAAGEDRENTLTKGSYYLTDDERKMLDVVTSVFDRVIVLMDVGNIIDMSWVKEYGDRISGLMMVWLGGMESGNAVADVLTGKVDPSGRLADTIAVHYEDYPSSANFGKKEYNNYDEGIYVGYRYFDRHPEKVLYPFGHGLSYTEFETALDAMSWDSSMTLASVIVTNKGCCAGRKAVLLWGRQPQEGLDKPEKVLIGFGKTGILEPGQSENLIIRFDEKSLSVYDESRNCFVLEKGHYEFSADDSNRIGFDLNEEKVIEQCESISENSFQLRKRILDRLPQAMPLNHEKYDLSEVKEGKITLEQFIGSLNDNELEALTRGHGMMGSALGTVGNAGVFGGILESLRDKGVSPITCADGPAGLRLKKTCALMPCGAGLACTFDQELLEALGEKIGEEMIHYDVDIQLAPGMNIHRNPLCGRNFEYFSEDPLLSGKIAAAYVRGVQSKGKACCPKHFACNNQEVNRNRNDSRVTERALREIYLRNFEIVVKESAPMTIMTSYNKINGIWSHYNYDLVTTVLRKEWGFTGTVITDWWMQKSASPEFPNLKDNAYRVRAQVDVLMPGDINYMAKEYKTDKSLLETVGKEGGLTRAEIQRTAANVLKLVMKLK